MNTISRQSMKCADLCRLSMVMLSGASLAIASTGCIDPPGGEAAAGRGVRVGDRPGADEPEGMRPTQDAAAVAGASLTTGGSVVTEPPGCYGPFTILAAGSARYVSAELAYTGGGTGMLRARATQPGPWETFVLCTDGIQWTINSSANGLWVSSELDYGGTGYAMLRARASSTGPWEQFSLYSNNDSDGTYSIQGPNTLLVAAEFGYSGTENGMLRSRTTGLTVGAWERFQLR